MKHLFVFLITVLVMMSCSVTKEKKTEPFTKGEFKEWAQTPPMGWNSWDCLWTYCRRKRGQSQY